MKNKDFMAEVSRRMGYSLKDTSALLSVLVSEIGDCLEEEQTIALQGFGTFEVKKKLERVVVNPTTQQRMLVPPKLAVTFKPSPLLKEKYNKED